MNLLVDVFRMRTIQGRGWMNLAVWDASTDSYTAVGEDDSVGLPTANTAGLVGTTEGGSDL